MRRSGATGSERGSVLILVPAGFLVLMLLAAIAVDSAAAFLGQRQLNDELSGAVNDASTAALANSSFYGSGTLAIDPAVAVRVVCQSIVAQGNGDLHDVSLTMAVDGTTIALRGRASVEGVFGRIIPGLGHYGVSATATAVAAGSAALKPVSLTAFEPIICPDP